MPSCGIPEKSNRREQVFSSDPSIEETRRLISQTPLGQLVEQTVRAELRDDILQRCLLRFGKRKLR